jgi:hypothetical protein
MHLVFLAFSYVDKLYIECLAVSFQALVFLMFFQDEVLKPFHKLQIIIT